MPSAGLCVCMLCVRHYFPESSVLEKISGIRQVVSYVLYRIFCVKPKEFSYIRALSYIDYLIS